LSEDKDVYLEYDEIWESYELAIEVLSEMQGDDERCRLLYEGLSEFLDDPET
jgi:hypothetical protein